MTALSEYDWSDAYEVVIGLEVHTHLATQSKLFSPAPVRYGEEPNHSVHWVDLALPGVLPVLNEQVVDLAIRLGIAVHATVNPQSVFARKNYFYPDLPKGYQISQYEEPVVSEGWIDIELDPEDVDEGEPLRKRIGVTRAHLEEDAGKSIHDAAVAGSDDTYIDLNRSGVPLLEIVSEPDMRSPAEAGAYLRAMHSILRYTGVSEADMEKGQFRCDANVSIRPHGQTEFGTRTELKNINSFRFVEAAIEAEIERQVEVVERGGTIQQATMAYDPDRNRTSVMRLKEDANDYRYFPDPDLIPLMIPQARIEAVRAAMPELPDAKRARFETDLGLSEYDAAQLVANRAVADFFERAAQAHGGQGAVESVAASAKSVANWVLRDVLGALKEADLEIDAAQLSPEGLAALVKMVDANRVTAKSARGLVAELVREGGDPEALVRERGLEAVSDLGLIEGLVAEVLAANPDAVETFRGGDKKALNFLMGQVMQKTQGKANPGQVRSLLANALETG